MKSHRFVLILCLGSFVLGVVISSVCWLSRTQARTLSAAPVATPTPTPRSDDDDLHGLIDDRNITKFNGTKLKLSYGSWALPVDIPYFIKDAKILPLKNGGLLVNAENMLYRLDDRHNIVWKYREAQPIWDYSLVESTGLIYGTAGDNVMFVLNVADGKTLHRDSRNGSAAYGVAVNYGTDMCLVTDNFVIYREKAPNIPPMNDGITCWRGTTALWHQDFPPDAQLAVNGDKIFAVTKTKTAIYLNEIHPPQNVK
jgi:hypothetical protein